MDELISFDNKLEYDVIVKNVEMDTTITSTVLNKYSEEEANELLSKNKITIRELIKEDVPNKPFIDDLFVSFTIISWIEKYANKMYEIKFKNVNVKIYINSNDNYEIDKIIENIVLIIEWMLKMSNKPNRNLNIIIYMSPFIKEINKILGFNEVNSGLSYVGKCSHDKCMDAYIKIFRKEELYKVLIHELVHNLEMDVSEYNFTKDIKHIILHKKSHKILVNEAYTELIALYFHSVFYSYKHGEPLIDVLKIEKKFSEKQINKILKIFDMDSINDFATPNNFIQYTNVIPYYIIKYLLLTKINLFVMSFNDKKLTVQMIKELLRDLYLLKIPKISVCENDKSLKMIYHDFL